MKTILASLLNAMNDPVLKNYHFQINRETVGARIPLEITIRHRSNGFAREINIAVPKNAIGNPRSIVVFMADGQLTHVYCRSATEFVQDSEFPPIACFGLSCNDSGVMRKNRADEYLGASGEDLFDHHYEAFIKVMPAVAQQLLKTPLKRDSTVVAGFSNGATFAYRMTMEHPELFGNAILMSPARLREPADLSRLDGYRTKVFLAAGEEGLERLFKKNALRIKQSLDQAGIPNTFWHDSDQGHDFFLWNDAFARGLDWLF